MRRVTLTHDTLAIENSKTEATARVCIPIHPEEEKELDCPDCFDRMIMLYDWDKGRYRCENCGLTNANPLLQSIYIVEEQEIK